jgi:S-adenosyl-L-methionine hydrolase (adenosine-forming)
MALNHSNLRVIVDGLYAPTLNTMESWTSCGLITLMTDFGLDDPFVGVMKGVIKTLCRDAEIIDLTHNVAPQDVRSGSFAWHTSWRYFPVGTVHVGVVDPGVGSERLALGVEVDGHVFVCPDNGLLTHILHTSKPRRIVRVGPPRGTTVSRTFHGRDVFAPAAAQLACGMPLASLGDEVGECVRLSLTSPDCTHNEITAHVVAFDRFGNACTDLTEEEFANWHKGSDVCIEAVGNAIAGPSPMYATVPEGSPVAVFASHGYLEVAIRCGNARQSLGLNVGDPIRIATV